MTRRGKQSKKNKGNGKLKRASSKQASTKRRANKNTKQEKAPLQPRAEETYPPFDDSKEALEVHEVQNEELQVEDIPCTESEGAGEHQSASDVEAETIAEGSSVDEDEEISLRPQIKPAVIKPVEDQPGDAAQQMDSIQSTPSRIVYDREFLLQFQKTCTTRLPEMPSFVSIYGMAMARPHRPHKPPRLRVQYFDHGEQKPEQTMPHNQDAGNWRPRHLPAAHSDKENDSPQAWTPNRRRSHQGEEGEAVLHEIKGILNKLTELNFNTLFVRILQVVQQSYALLTGVVDQIFAKALQEPGFASLYARLCHDLDQQCPKFPHQGEVVTFKKALISKCQQEFEQRSQCQSKKEEGADDENAAEARMLRQEKDKRKIAANVAFIGELYKTAMLPDIVMHICVKSLLHTGGNKAASATEADLEALCVLLSTIGGVFVRKAARAEPAAVAGYFAQMQHLAGDTAIPSRVRFKLLDVIELKQRNWQPKLRA